MLKEDKTPTKPKRPSKLFDVVLIDVPPSRRMKVMDVMLHNDYYPELSLLDAMVLVFKVPSVVMHCCELKDAVVLEMIFEVHGATVNIRPARFCGEEEDEAAQETSETADTDELLVPVDKREAASDK